MFRFIRQYYRIFGFAVETLPAFGVRSIFTIMAVALGIASLTIIVTSVDGAQRMAYQILEMFGPDAAFILGGDIRNRPVGQRVNTLTFEDVARLEQSLPGAYLVVPMRAVRSKTAKSGNQNTDIPTVVGATEGYGEAWNWPLSEGRDFTHEDVKRGAKVGLIAHEASRKLFGDESPIGKSVFIGDLPIQIVGKLSYRGATSGGGSSLDDRMIIPITTLTQRFNLDRKYFRALRVKFVEPEFMPSHVENLRSFLRHLHGLKPGEDDDFTILTADEVLKFLSMLQGSLLVFLGVTAAVAMVVGGFVLANLFYLSVQERTTEIGLRKAMGAKNIHITVQFLMEAVLLTGLGALVGLGLGWGLGKILADLGILDIQYSPKVFVYAATSSLAVGVIFGLRPARKAASLEPVQAMRVGG